MSFLYFQHMIKKLQACDTKDLDEIIRNISPEVTQIADGVVAVD